MVSKIVCGVLCAASIALGVTPVQAADERTNRAFRRLFSSCGSGVNFNGYRNYNEFIAPNIGVAMSHDGQVAISPFPWMHGGMNASTTARTSSAVHPTARYGVVDALTAGAWTGWGYGPFGNGTYGGFRSWAFSNGDNVCPAPEDNVEPPTRRLVYAYVIAARTGNNVWCFGSAGPAGMLGQGVCALVYTDELQVEVHPGPNGFLVRARRSTDPAWTNYGVLPIVNLIFRAEAQPCAGWFIDARTDVATVALTNSGPTAAGILGIAAHGWQYQDFGPPPQGGIAVIQNPDLRQIPGAPNLKPMPGGIGIPGIDSGEPPAKAASGSGPSSRR